MNSFDQFKQESINVNLTEWSTTERLARIQEVDDTVLQVSVKTNKRIEIINITPKGIEPPVRDARDGVVYFGCKKKDKNGSVAVDYKLRVSNSKYREKYRGPHFMIYFDLNYKNFFLHDLVIGFGTFLKISHTLSLENDQLLNLGDSFILVNIIPRYESDNYPKLRLKAVNGNNISEIFYFNAQEFYLSSIVIGRSTRCQVYIDDSMISKQHASIVFTADKKWVIIDGTANKNSLNGTWLYVSKDCKLEPGLEFKACESVFRVIK